jgi:hypothetical protein
VPVSDILTVGQVSAVLGVPAWKIRRVVDALQASLPRAGSYRLIPRAMLGQIAIELDRQGWLSEKLPSEAAK